MSCPGKGLPMFQMVDQAAPAMLVVNGRCVVCGEQDGHLPGCIANRIAATPLPKKEKRTFAEIRQAKCDKCEHANGDTCLITEAKHPGRASIAHGVVRPELRCPLPEPRWVQSPATCQGCGRARQILSLGRECVYCANDRGMAERNARNDTRINLKRARSSVSRYKPSTIDWFVAITTAPRKACTLTQCVDSVRKAGWEPMVFAEPGATETDAKTITNSERLGVWNNWLSVARYALENTNANTIMTVQDDSSFHPDSRSFAESILWPEKGCGYLSLYTPSHYSSRLGHAPGVFRIRTGNMWGACALIFSRESLETILSHKLASSWVGVHPKRNAAEVMARRRSNPSLIANSDTAIGRIVTSLGLPTYYVSPSPVEHIAAHSTISHGGNTGRRNCYRCADHGRPLAGQVFG
jgi:hypothetical protein